MPWYYAVAERDHELQNPTSPEKIRWLGELLRLGPESRVLDVACGMAGPALVLASTYGCRILGVERSPEFVAAGRARIAAAGLGGRIEIVEADASTFAIEDGAFDAALCLGATFVYGGLEGTLAALAPAAPRLAVGEPFWHDGRVEDGYVDLRHTADRFRSAGLTLTGLIASSLDDWDRYESLHWRALEEYLAEHDDPEIRARHERDRDHYLREQRTAMGWAIFVAQATRAG